MKYLVLLFGLLGSTPLFANVIWYPLPVEAYRFGEVYPEAQKLLFAFDYGHALVYERLLQNRDLQSNGVVIDPKEFEADTLAEIIHILKNPPAIKDEESDIAPEYYYQFTRIVNLFDWSHMLHQFILDVLATSQDRGPKMQKRIQEIFAKYKSEKRIAITDVCKTMLFMDGHYFSKAFRRAYPSFNGLIWSYHWFQIKLYEDLLKPTKIERDQAVKKTINGFWALIADLPDSADFDMMPETAVEAPTLAKLFPTIPAAFDNNHMLHDIVSDILTSDKVKYEDLRAEGIRMAGMDLDPEAFRSNKCPVPSPQIKLFQ